MSDDDDSDNSDIAEATEWENLVDGAMEMLERFNNFLERLIKLETSISEVQDCFLSLYQQDPKRLHDELKVLEENYSQKNWLKQVEGSIVRLFTIRQYSQEANAVNIAGTALGRKTPFEGNILTPLQSVRL